MSHINRQLAPGLAGIMAGNTAHFVVPQNPLEPYISPTVVAIRAPHLSEIMPAKFVVPENPLLNALSGKTMPGRGCGCGMGALDFSSLSSLGTSISTWFSSIGTSVSTVPWTVWAAGGAAVLLLLYMSGGGRPGYRSARREAIQKLKEKYPTRGGRVQRAVASYSD